MAETEIVFSVKRSPESGYEARALDHSIFTHAGTMAELETKLKDAVAYHFAERKTLPTIRLVKV